MRVYLKTPGLTQQDGVRPTPAGMGVARDVFMLGSGVGLLLDELTDRSNPPKHSTLKAATRGDH